MVILSIVSIAAVGLFFAFTKHFEQSADLTAARQDVYKRQVVALVVFAVFMPIIGSIQGLLAGA